MDVNSRLKELAAALGLNYQELSERTGIPYRTLYQYIRGDRQPAIDSLAKIASAVNCDLNWLVLGRGPMFMVPQTNNFGGADGGGLPTIPGMGEPDTPEQWQMMDVVQSVITTTHLVSHGGPSSVRSAWVILEVLSQGSAMSRSDLYKGALARALAVSDIRSGLAKLEEAGLVEVDRRGEHLHFYSLSHNTLELRSILSGDVGQHALEGIRTLTQQIVPGLDSNQATAGLVTARIRVARGAGLLIIKSLRSVVKDLLSNAEKQHEGNDEEVTVLLGVDTSG